MEKGSMQDPLAGDDEMEFDDIGTEGGFDPQVNWFNE